MNEGKHLGELRPVCYRVHDETERKEYAKWQVRPLMGWPDGEDPYPNHQDDDIVMAASFDRKLRIECDVIYKEEIQVGDYFCFDNKTWLVIEFTSQKRHHKITAIHYKPCKTTTK